jgi:hypothetical protein
VLAHGQDLPFFLILACSKNPWELLSRKRLTVEALLVRHSTVPKPHGFETVTPVAEKARQPFFGWRLIGCSWSSF